MTTDLHKITATPHTLKILEQALTERIAETANLNDEREFRVVLSIVQDWRGDAAQNPTCSQCHEKIEDTDERAGYGMCGSCLHDALRSGWTPGEED